MVKIEQHEETSIYNTGKVRKRVVFAELFKVKPLFFLPSLYINVYIIRYGYFQLFFTFS